MPVRSPIKKYDWSIWDQFCQQTQREKVLADKVASIMLKKNQLPCQLLLDVGCGNGEFSDFLLQYANSIIGIDIIDYRKNNLFQFIQSDFSNYKGPLPEVIIIKQSFHLLVDSFNIFNKYPKSSFVIIQMSKPEWCDDWDNEAECSDKNLVKIKSMGRDAEMVKLEHAYKLSISFLEQMFCIGYTSTLQRLSQKSRNNLWNYLKNQYESNGGYFLEKLNIIFVNSL